MDGGVRSILSLSEEPQVPKSRLVQLVLSELGSRSKHFGTSLVECGWMTKISGYRTLTCFERCLSLSTMSSCSHSPRNQKLLKMADSFLCFVGKRDAVPLIIYLGNFRDFLESLTTIEMQAGPQLCTWTSTTLPLKKIKP